VRSTASMAHSAATPATWRLVTGALAALAVAAATAAGAASAVTGTYHLAATQSCLQHKGDKVSIEPKVAPAMQRLEPYGSLGGLVWNEGSGGHEILIEFGKSPSEAAAMFDTIAKVFGKTAAAHAAVAKGNVLFYTNHLKLTPPEIATVEGCLH
jgi:hypothetical protein